MLCIVEVCGVVSKPNRNGKKRENAVQSTTSSLSAGAVGYRNPKSSTHQIKECDKRQKGKSNYGGSHRKNDHKVTCFTHLFSFSTFFLNFST